MHAIPGIIIALALTVFAAKAEPAVAQPADPGAARPAAFFPSEAEVAQLVRPYIDGRQARGIVVGLVEPDGRRRVLAFGDAGEGLPPLSADSVFEIGSITKTFTGAVLADMVRRGEVRLDDPVGRYLPEGVRVPTFEGRQITLLDLATHMSGLPRLPDGYVPPDPANPYARFAASDLYAFLQDYALTRAPGAQFEYSNLGMGLLGHALARAAGADSFQSLVADRVLHPLGMSSTAYGRPEALLPRMTRGHDANGDSAPYFDVAALAGGGGLNASVSDLLAYLDANLGEPSSPLEQAMRDAQRGHRSPRPGVGLGLGWMRMTRGPLTLVGLNGNTTGYSTYLAINPDVGAGVVVLANTGGFEHADAIGRRLLDPQWSLEPAPRTGTPAKHPD
ncbi:serine hydrolase domain-containing protein [Luteimonas sp. SDU101]|uniref:serine hydrolase domain-containing protein n=1 Tax=Luteimonas sp. SDU101 TaxID=3422593 RepID=UPI003EBE4A4B